MACVVLCYWVLFMHLICVQNIGKCILSLVHTHKHNNVYVFFRWYPRKKKTFIFITSFPQMNMKRIPCQRVHSHISEANSSAVPLVNSTRCICQTAKCLCTKNDRTCVFMLSLFPFRHRVPVWTRWNWWMLCNFKLVIIYSVRFRLQILITDRRFYLPFHEANFVYVPQYTHVESEEIVSPCRAPFVKNKNQCFSSTIYILIWTNNISP